MNTLNRSLNSDHCPVEAKNQIIKLNEILLSILENNLLGTYVHGSLSLQSFNPLTSDIDVIVLVNHKIDLDIRFHLIKELLHISNKPYPIEISFLTKDAIFPWQYPTPFELHCSEYWREKYEERVAANDKEFWAETPTDSDLAVHLTLLRLKGICVYGLPVKDTFPHVPEADFRSSILSDIDYAIKVLHTNPTYGILTLCRILSYLETGEIYSKGEAGLWAIPTIPDRFHYMVKSVVELYAGSRENLIDIQGTDLEDFGQHMKIVIAAKQ